MPNEWFGCIAHNSVTVFVLAYIPFMYNRMIRLQWAEPNKEPQITIELDADAAEWLCSTLELHQPKDKATAQLRRAIAKADAE